MKTSWIAGIALLAVVGALGAEASAETSAPAASPAPAAPAAAPAPEAPTSAASRLSAARLANVDKAELEARLKAVAQLIEKSSAARQIETSGSERERELHRTAQETHRAAQAAFDAGELPRASQLLTQASTLMFDAVRLAQPQSVTADKEKTDYQTRLESVKALLTAYKRISTEKSNVQGAAETRQNVEAGMAEAESLAAAGKHAEARAVLERAYLVAKAGIASVRGGDTLIRSLKFANKEEEYHYELDRNDTHQMLIKLLLEEKGRAANDVAQQGFMEKAQTLRKEAEASAGKGNFGAAVELLEKSTTELVRAIRNAGIYIPG